MGMIFLVKRINCGRQSVKYQMPLQIQATHTQKINFIPSSFFASRFTVNWFIFEKKWTCETVYQLNCVSDLLHPHIHMSHMQLFFSIGLMCERCTWCFLLSNGAFFHTSGWKISPQRDDFGAGRFRIKCSTRSLPILIFQISSLQNSPPCSPPVGGNDGLTWEHFALAAARGAPSWDKRQKFSRWFDSWPHLIP